MKQRLFVSLVLILCVFLSGCSALERRKGQKAEEQRRIEEKEIAELSEIKLREFVFGPGDEFEVAVWRQENLTRTVTVNPDGTVSFSYIDAFKAEGLTYAELKREFETRLSEYYKTPKVSINVNKVGSQKAYVLGYVRSPGVYPIDKNTKILSVIARAGGFDSDADRRSVIYIENSAGKTVGHRVNTMKALEQGDLRYNIPVNANDIIYVPRSFIADVDAFMGHAQNIFNTVIALERSIILFEDASNVIRNKESGGGGSASTVIVP